MMPRIDEASAAAETAFSDRRLAFLALVEDGFGLSLQPTGDGSSVARLNHLLRTGEDRSPLCENVFRASRRGCSYRSTDRRSDDRACGFGGTAPACADHGMQ